MNASGYQVVQDLGAEQHGLVTARQLLGAKFSPREVQELVASRRLLAVERGVLRLPGVRLTPLVRLQSAILAAPSGALASHRSAAALFGLPGFRLAAPTEITMLGRAGSRREGRVIHRTTWLPSHHQRIVKGMPVTSVARTLFDLTAVVRPARAERALDTCLARRIVTLPALSRILGDVARRGRRKTTVFRSLLQERGAGYVAPESELEAIFLELVGAAGLPEPQRQVDLGDADAWIGRVDFRFPGTGVIVEVDGAEFHSSLTDRRADEQRDRRLRESGRDVLRFEWSDITVAGAHVVAELRAALGSRAA